MPASHLSTLLRDLALQHGNRPAVVSDTTTLSFIELDRSADAWAAGLREAGHGPGSHVGLLAGNGPDWLAAAFGVWRAGATLVPISTFVTERELAETLAHADVSALIVQPQLRSRDHLAALRHIPSLPTLRTVLAIKPGFPPAVERQPDLSLHDPNQIACILYTSGTTGKPKGVMLPHRSILATVGPTAERSGLDATDSLLSTLPLFWVAGLVIRALPTLASGCGLLLVETFTVDAAITMLRRHRPTALHLRPPQVGQILAHADFDADLLANVRKGGGRSEWYAPHMKDARLITGYGMTEMSGYVTALDWQDTDEVRRTQIGALQPGVEMHIIDRQGVDRETGETGEIVVRGPGMFAGYYKEAPGTGLDASGWFRTGDLGSIDGEGVFHFAGRGKDLLRVKGINVSPAEVETVLASHPGVEAAYVVGLPPDALEQRVVALVVIKSADASEAVLRAWAEQQLSHYKRPEHYIFIERSEVQLGSTSKPQRAALAELAIERLAAV
jgi:fatty-acyl-CoA synthase